MSKNPNDIQNYKSPGETWAQAAMRHETQALVKSNTTRAWEFRKAAICHEQDKNIKKAAENYVKEATYRPDEAGKCYALVLAANHYEQLEDLSNAAECLIASISFQKFPVLAMTRAASFLAQDGQEERAIEYFEQAYQLAEGDAKERSIIKDAMLKHINPLSVEKRFDRLKDTHHPIGATAKL